MKIIAKKDPYLLPKMALQPLLKDFSSSLLYGDLMELSPQKRDELASFLQETHLSSLWLEYFGKKNIAKVWTIDLAEMFQRQYRQFALLYSKQLIYMQEVSQLLERHAIPHAVFKGVHTREIAYMSPPARYSVDIDILIPEQNRSTVLTLLLSAGFQIHIDSKNITHEVSLNKNNILIDLHWHIMRPGRIPRNLTIQLLKNRVNQRGYWSLSNEDNLFILLTHPVFTKYLSIPEAGLLRLADLLFWLKVIPTDWDKVFRLLSNTGLRSAAWIILEYTKLLTGQTPPSTFSEAISPSCLKQWYIRQWITNNRLKKLRKYPVIPKLFFTTLCHDNPFFLARLVKTLLYSKVQKDNINSETIEQCKKKR